MKKILFMGVALSFSSPLMAQVTFPRNDVQDKPVGLHYFKNATIHVSADQTIENGSMLVKDNQILSVGRDVAAPKGAIVHDLKGKHLYPSFIEPYGSYGMPKVERKPGGGFYNQVMESSKKGAFAANEAIKPETHASQLFTKDAKAAEEWRKEGFGATVVHQKDGIARGTGAFVTLGDGLDNEIMLKERVSNHFSMSKGTSRQSYPVSIMGSVALLRQAYLDADWYKRGGEKQERNLSLAAFNQNLALPQVCEAKDVHDLLRVDKIGDEFGHQYIIKTDGDEYQKLRDVKKTGAKLIVGLNFPETKDVEDPFDAELVSLRELKHWELAPANLANLAKEGIEFIITADGLKSPSAYLKNIRKAVQYGLPKNAALRAMTSGVAQVLQLPQVGELKAGNLANFLITSGDIFEENSQLFENWITGNRFILKNKDVTDLRGTYQLTIDGKPYRMKVTGEIDAPKFDFFESDSVKVDSKVTRTNDLLTINLKDKNQGVHRLSGYFLDGRFEGQGLSADARPITWSGNLVKTDSASTKKLPATQPPAVGSIIFPFTAYGNAKLPVAETVLIKNATVWTNEKEGIAQNMDVLVSNGRISAVGKNLSSPNATVFDGTGKHLTSGIIDEHSHIALFSINEIDAVSAEVRQSDALDADDIDIYRQLAGGVTAAQLLHGSADCIGGQSALVKLRWGVAPQELLIDKAEGFIKFALGENPKRGNAPQTPNRYPATRMGVEQVIRDAFQQAKEYKAAWAAYNASANKASLTPPRRDLKLEAVAEILDKKRHISCHSYVQSEINMLMELSKDMGFPINTFTHILEGYKLADKMKQQGINASTFSDWWAYKMEVKEAIPFNAAIMHKVGVNTAINSDDAEMARRLNQEAAKVMLYGGVSEEDAWKMVTLNPAKMLRLDNRMGSIKVGKDADLVLWTANPLSVYARPVATWVDGIRYFDADSDKAKQLEVAQERNRIIQKMIDAKKGGAPAVRPERKVKPDVHCDSMLEFGGISVEMFNEQLQN